MVVYDFSAKTFPYEYVLNGIVCLILVAIAIFMLLFSVITVRNRSKLLPSKLALSICGFLVASVILFFISDNTIDQINSLRFMKSSIDNGTYEIIEGKIEHCESIYNRPSIFYDPPTDYYFSVNGKLFFTDEGNTKGKCYFTPEQEKYIKNGTKVRIKYVYYKSTSVFDGEDMGEYVDNGEEAVLVSSSDNRNEILYFEILDTE